MGVLRRLAPSTRRDHLVDEGLARVGGDADDDALGGRDPGAAGDGAAVAAGFAHDRRRFAGDRRFVHQRGAEDDVPVTGDQLVGFHQDEVALAQVVGVDLS